MNKYSVEANLLLDVLNGLVMAYQNLTGRDKSRIAVQIEKILAYFEEHQTETPIGRSVTLGYYFKEDLSYHE